MATKKVNSLNVVPLIDILLVLFVVVMAIASFEDKEASQKAVKIEELKKQYKEKVADLKAQNKEKLQEVKEKLSASDQQLKQLKKDAADSAKIDKMQEKLEHWKQKAKSWQYSIKFRINKAGQIELVNGALINQSMLFRILSVLSNRNFTYDYAETADAKKVRDNIVRFAQDNFNLQLNVH